MGKKVVQMDAYRRLIEDDRADEVVNQLWDAFERQADSCWEWRDHESLDVLECIIKNLRPLLEARRS